jgi:hypothetical protein
MLTALPMVVMVGRGQNQVEVSLDTPLLSSRFLPRVAATKFIHFGIIDADN